MYNNLYEELCDWEVKNFAAVNVLTKGSNFFVEHFSAVSAEVADPEDPGTLLNTNFISLLQNVDIIGIAGEALSHCVANTFRDVADNFGEENIKKLVLLTDCSSSVPGFEKLGEQFVKDMTIRGMKTSTSVDFLK